MITPRLEQFIFDGKAKMKSHVWSISQVGTIPVPSGKIIVITDVWIHPFANFGDAGEWTPAQYLGRSTHRFVMQSAKAKFNIVIRASYNGFYSNELVSDITIATPNCDALIPGPFHFPDYQLHESDVQLRVFEVTPPGAEIRNGNTVIDIPPPEANEPLPPEGYGGVGVLQAIDNFPGDRRYLPMGVGKRTAVGAKNPGSQDQYLDVLPTQIDAPVGVSVDHSTMWHLVNFRYVEIDVDDSLRFLKQ